MKSLFKIIFLLLVPSIALCETKQSDEVTALKCNFTEPFFNLASIVSINGVDQKQGMLLMNGPEVFDAFDTFIDKKRNAQGLEELTFKIQKTGEVILRAIKNNQGSDGMSDIVYPYDAIYTRDDFKFYGGCKLETLNPQDAIPMS